MKHAHIPQLRAPLSCLLLLIIAAAAGLLINLPCVSAIVQGEIDTENKYGMVCALLKSNGAAYDAVCSSVLVNPSALLTAAHCADLFDYVSCDYSVAGRPTLFNKSLVEVHPSYNDRSLTEDQKQDLAVIKLQQGLPGKALAPMPPQFVLNDLQEAGSFEADQPLVVVGYGGTRLISDPYAQDGGDGAPNKDRRFSPADFVRLTVFRMIINVSLNRGTGGSICRGDSGGAVFYLATGLLMGITVEADSQCNKNGIVNRIDTPAVRSWLAVQGVNIP